VTTTTAGPGPLRFGLVGTGYWARETHAPAITAAPEADLVAVWGRDVGAATSLATTVGATAYADFDDFLAQVDAVCFAVPPHVQAELAVRAAGAGRHLLLEKPVALDLARGRALLAAVREHDVAAVVFFTHLFTPAVRTWFDEVGVQGPWSGGQAVWLGSALTDDNPFNTPWRREHGGLWDVGPHAVAALTRTLGPITSVTVDRGEPDLTFLVLHHENGATSSATLTLSAPDAADGFSLQLWGAAGRSDLPIDEVDSTDALTVAVTELTEMARTGRREHPSDLPFGLAVQHVLDRAQRGRPDADGGVR
jgi:predicted dehydrogenase